jgi:hypothetical protein
MHHDDPEYEQRLALCGDKAAILSDLQRRTDIAIAFLRVGEALTDIGRLLDEATDCDAEKHGIDPEDYFRGTMGKGRTPTVEDALAYWQGLGFIESRDIEGPAPAEELPRQAEGSQRLCSALSELEALATAKKRAPRKRAPRKHPLRERPPF